MRDYEINSDLKQSKFESLKFVQGDTGSKIIVNLFEDSQAVNLASCTVLAKYKRADGYTDNKNASIEDNKITVEIDETMTATVGVLKLVFQITYETSKKVSTFMLLADVAEGIGAKSTTGGGTGDIVVDVDLSNYYTKSEVNSLLNNIANEDLVIGEDGKLHIKQGDGTEKGTGVEIPSSTELPSNVVTYEEETETDEDIVTAQNIKLVDTSNNFEATDVEGALSELFQSASSGKQAIATAITGKGVNTSASDTFEQMATNIGQISTGSVPTASINISENGTYDVTNYASAIVNVASQGVESGSFTPSENILTQILATSKQCSSVVVIKSSATLTNIGARQIASYVQIGTIGRGIATNSSGNSWSRAIVKNGVSYATFGATSITLNFKLEAGSGYMVAGEQYDWFAW